MTTTTITTLLDPKERSDRGLANQEYATGKAPPVPATPLEETWRDFTFAEVWNRPGLDKRARFLVAIAGTVMNGADAEIMENFVRGALKSKELSLVELREGALHLAVYGGWLRAQRLDSAITRVAAELGLPPADCAPIRGAPWDPQVRNDEGAAEFTAVMTFPGSPPMTPYLEAINNFVFGEMWCRRALDERSRRWLTLVGVADSGAEIPIKSHFYASMTSGNVKPEELHEFVLQYGVQSGWPRASLVQSVVFEMIGKVEAGKMWSDA